jgi:hypothetical protein
VAEAVAGRVLVLVAERIGVAEAQPIADTAECLGIGRELGADELLSVPGTARRLSWRGICVQGAITKRFLYPVCRSIGNRRRRFCPDSRER